MTPDDWRNFGHWLTERTKVRVEWSKSILNLRVGFQRAGKWIPLSVLFWKPVVQNFWNGIFTLNCYILKTTFTIRLRSFIVNIPIFIPRVGVVIRYSHDRWFEAGVGYLFDRGEFGAKFTFMEWTAEERYNPGVNAVGWEEGAV